MSHVLVIAGHDPSGGAGVVADAEALSHFGARATCVVTAHTDQTWSQVRSIGAREPGDWLAEAQAVESVDVIKIGLLPGAEHVRALVELVARRDQRVPLVLDPVLAASDGTTFLDQPGREALLDALPRLGPVLTPNLPELERLAGERVDRSAWRQRESLARQLVDRGAAAVIVKGGHGAEDPIRDLVIEPNREATWLTRRRLHGASIRGSGCRFASAVAAGLASGSELPLAARSAGRWLAHLLLCPPLES